MKTPVYRERIDGRRGKNSSRIHYTIKRAEKQDLGAKIHNSAQEVLKNRRVAGIYLEKYFVAIRKFFQKPLDKKKIMCYNIKAVKTVISYSKDSWLVYP